MALRRRKSLSKSSFLCVLAGLLVVFSVVVMAEAQYLEDYNGDGTTTVADANALLMLQRGKIG